MLGLHAKRACAAHGPSLPLTQPAVACAHPRCVLEAEAAALPALPCRLGPTPHTTWLSFDVDFAFKSPLYRHVASVFFEEVRCSLQ